MDGAPLPLQRILAAAENEGYSDEFRQGMQLVLHAWATHLQLKEAWALEPDEAINEAGERKELEQAGTLPRLQRRQGVATVYYGRRGNAIKIGTTRNMPQRMRALMFDEILAWEPGDYTTEARRHAQFDNLRLTGEWFQDTPEIRGFLEDLREEFGTPHESWATLRINA